VKLADRAAHHLLGIEARIDEVEAGLESRVERALDLAMIDAAGGRAGEADVAATDRCDRCISEGDATHARSLHVANHSVYDGRMRKLAVLLLIAACGDDGVRHTPDAAPHDGPVVPDGPVDTAGTPVAITVAAAGTPVPGVHVYFQNADSTLVLATTTDASGTASAVMVAGGYVTAVDPFPIATLAGGNHTIETFGGVKPGDHLQITDGAQSTSINVTIQAPADGAASSYLVFSPCNSDGTSITTPPLSAIANPATGPMTLDGCGATTDFLVVSYDQNAQPLNFFYAPNVAVADAQTIDLTASTYVAASTRTLTFQNVPGLQSLSFEDDLIDPQGAIFRTLNETTSDTLTPVVTELVPAFTGAASLVQSTFGGNYEQQTVLDWGPYTDSYTVDVTAHALLAYANFPAYDVASHTATITEGTTGLTPDFTIALLNATREADGTTWDWITAAPHGASVVLPVLPTDLYDFNIAASDAAGVEAWATGKVPGGYDAVRERVLSISGVAGFATSSSGTATLATFQQGGGLARTRLLRSFQSTMVHHASTVAPRSVGRRVR
jgi:hypothetical protein